MVSFRFSIFNQKHCNKSYLDNGRYTWRHKYVLLAIAKSLSSLQHCTLFADPPSFASPSLITGDSLRPDLALISRDKTLYLLELTVGFETNIFINSSRKSAKYNSLIKKLILNFLLSTLSIFLWVLLVFLELFPFLQCSRKLAWKRQTVLCM